MHILCVDIGGSGIKGTIVDTETGELVTKRPAVFPYYPYPGTKRAIRVHIRSARGFQAFRLSGFPVIIAFWTDRMVYELIRVILSRNNYGLTKPPFFWVLLCLFSSALLYFFPLDESTAVNPGWIDSPQ